MLTILLLLFTLNPSSSGIPLQIPTDGSNNVPIVVFGRELPECMNIARFRTLQEIIWSCLVTIFACTWVAVHPNLPGPYDCDWTKLKRKVMIMVYAILAPELMTMWAMRQWFFAQEIVREFNKKDNNTNHEELLSGWMNIKNTVKGWFRDGPRQSQSKEWTLTHGFFLQMGGFILCDSETPLRVLEFEELKKLVAENQVELPRISEAEISDKSKGEFLTKLFVVLQTTWFIVQCLTRWATHLPVTELEVVTLAFSALNIITYGLWWKKPQNALVAFSVHMKGKVNDEPQQRIGNDESWIWKKVIDARKTGWVGLVFVVPWRLFQAFLRPIGKLMGEPNYPPGRSLRVPMFFVDGRERNIFDSNKISKANLPTLAIGFLFGGLHLVPWSSNFPSTVERWLWRSSALVLTVEPVAIFLFNVFGQFENALCVLGWFISAGLLFPGIPLYFLARVTLLVLAFTTLRNPPQDIYANIPWTTFVPHV